MEEAVVVTTRMEGVKRRCEERSLEVVIVAVKVVRMMEKREMELLTTTEKEKAMETLMMKVRKERERRRVVMTQAPTRSATPH